MSSYCAICAAAIPGCSLFFVDNAVAFPAGFLASRVPDNLDAIIIGSGIGGLGLGVLLAKVGKKVLVLEQHDRAGGCCHTFTEKGFEFDVGEKNPKLRNRCDGFPFLFVVGEPTPIFQDATN